MNSAGVWLLRWPGAVLVVSFFGLISLLLGQDANWDLANYHLYNAHAFLHGRIDVDLAAAGFQSYFNPLLDLPYYWMTMNLPARSVAFAMGALHGLNLLLVAGIARCVLPQATSAEVFLLALAGSLGPTFLSELGNTMGDSTTALLVLASLLLCLRLQTAPTTASRNALLAFAAAGLVMGLAVGLKLTNAIYAVGLCSALLLTFHNRRWLVVLACGVGIVAGIALTAGFWFVKMWNEFGNPLFPQFNALFGSELALPINIIDTRWRPKGLVEALFFPFVFTLNPSRLGEADLVQVLWPVAYTLFLVWAVHSMSMHLRWRTAGRGASTGNALSPGSQLLLAFVAVSYLVWLAVFSIGRYTIAMELLLPLVTWLLLHRLAGVRRAGQLARAVIAAALVIGLVGFKTGTYASFAAQSYSVRPPKIDQPAHTTVLMLAAPTAWMIPFFPSELSFVSFFQFPESEGYHQRAAAIMQARGGDVWAIVPAASDTVRNTMMKFNEWARSHGVRSDTTVCNGIQWALRRSARRKMVTLKPESERGGLCLLDIPLEHRRDLQAENRAIAQHSAEQVRARALSLDADSCVVHDAYLGAREMPYQFCKVTRE